jgi:hypothetical protein
MADRGSQFRVGRIAIAAHPGKGIGDRTRRPEGQAGDDGAACENLGIGRQHDGRHGTARRQPGDENTIRVDPVPCPHRHNHLMDRQGFTRSAPGIHRREPVEAEVGVIRAFLLWEQQRKTQFVGQLRPARPVIVATGGLRASMQNHDQRRAGSHSGRHIKTRRQGAGVRSEVGHIAQAIRSNAPDSRAAVDAQPGHLRCSRA